MRNEARSRLHVSLEPVQTGKTQISLRICAVSSDHVLSIWHSREYMYHWFLKRTPKALSNGSSGPSLEDMCTIIWASLAKRGLRTCAKCTDTDLSYACAKSHPDICSPLIHSIVSNDSVSGQRRPWSDCADAQADLGIRCPHMPETSFRMTRHIFTINSRTDRHE